MCSEGCTGKTATGIDIRNRTPKIIAVDPDVIPLGTVVEIFVDGKSIGQYTAADTGGGINGHEIDILMKTEKQARNFGRQQVDLKIIGKKKLSAV
ncbi:Cell wall-binding protein YocH precursor [compost metagenome]